MYKEAFPKLVFEMLNGMKVYVGDLTKSRFTEVCIVNVLTDSQV